MTATDEAQSLGQSAAPEQRCIPDLQARSVSRSIGLTFVGQVLVFALGMAFGILTARLLGVTGKGHLNTLLVGAGLFGALLDFGLRTSLTRAVAAQAVRWKEGLLTLLGTHALFLTLLCVTLLYFFGFWHDRWFPQLPASLILLAACLLPIGILEGGLISVLAGYQRLPETVGIYAIGKAISLVTLITFTVIYHFHVAGALGAVLFGTLVEACLLWRYLLRFDGGVSRIRTDLLPHWLRFGATCQAANFATQLNYRLDALLVFAFTGAPAAGLYAVAVSVAELPLQIPNSIASVLMPRVSADALDAVQRTTKFARLTTQLIIISGLLFAVAGPYLLPLLYGTPFSDAYTALLLLLPGMVMLGQSKVLSADLVGRGYPRYTATASWIGLGVTLCLDILLIPRWGIGGAAAASSIAYTVAALVLMWSFRAVTGVSCSRWDDWQFRETREVLQYLFGKWTNRFTRHGRALP